MKQTAPIIVKKKKSHEHAHHGGSWKVAYADFVTAMMAFFLVMWIMGLSDDKKNQIQGYFNDPLAFMKQSPTSRTIIRLPSMAAPGPGANHSAAQQEMDQEVQSMSDLKAEIQTQLNKSASKEAQDLAKNVDIIVTDQGLLIEFLDSNKEAFFELGQAIIRPTGRELFLTVAKVLSKHKRAMIIQGHTDSRKYGGFGYDNWDLSADRAIALKRVLMQGNVTNDQIKGIDAFADTKLRRPEDPMHYSNRRVSILLPYVISNKGRKNLPKADLKSKLDGSFRKDKQIAPLPSPLMGGFKGIPSSKPNKKFFHYKV